MTEEQPDSESVPTLVMTGGALDGTAYPLVLQDGETILGASMDAGIQIMLGNVEPFHARILLGREGLAIEDAGINHRISLDAEGIELFRVHPGQYGPGHCENFAFGLKGRGASIGEGNGRTGDDFTDYRDAQNVE